jgi:hypothetical protein
VRRYAEIGNDIAQQTLDQKSAAHYQTELLQQHDAALHVELRIQIVEVHPQEDGEQHGNQVHQTAVVHQVDPRVHVQRHVNGNDEGRSDQQDLGYQQHHCGCGNEDAKDASHLGAVDYVSPTL